VFWHYKSSCARNRTSGKFVSNAATNFAAPVTASIGNQEMEFVVNVEHMRGTNIAILAPYDFTRFTMKSNRSEAAPIFLAFRS
jgi:hypothetical protein